MDKTPAMVEKMPLPEKGQEYHIPQVIPTNKWHYRCIKRILDIVMALIGLIVLFVPSLLLAVVIRVDSKGFPIFKQKRLGKNGKQFTMYKFRSMRVDAERNGPQWADRDDPRCTAVGKFLRRTRLDELPQLWNILKGDMSLVGPRPERACFYDQFETYIHGFRNRLAVRPGLTGLAQINGGYDLQPEEKILYDMEYIEKRSLKLDAYCIFKTFHLLVTHEGAR